MPPSSLLFWRRRMSRSLTSIVALSVIVMCLWHIYAAHDASFVLELLETELGIVNSDLKSQHAQLVSRVNHTQEILKHMLDVISGLQHNAKETDDHILEKLQQLVQENEQLQRRSRNIAKVITDTSTQWKPLKDLTKFSIRGFISEIISRNDEQGPPELFEFPSALSNGRHLCFKGNDTSNGTRNWYMFAWEEAMPSDYILLNGTTLISETEYDFTNPWHAMYNLLQFAYWRWTNGCTKAERLILFHWSELRRSMGAWISQIFTAAGLPAQPEAMAIGDRPICFQRAVVSRLGLGGVPGEMLRQIYAQVRCQVRTLCSLPTTRTTTLSAKQSITVTLMIRSGAREWKDPEAWERVVATQCAKVDGCLWSSMYVANMTFCEQVKTMMETDILVSVHGAQLTNMIFMSPGGRILEMFPRGWLELAGSGQYIYRGLAGWVGLVHEGYWRDFDQPHCPYENENERCFTFFKDQNVGINETHISGWLGSVLEDFKSARLAKQPASSDTESGGDHRECVCRRNETQQQVFTKETQNSYSQSRNVP